MIDHRDYQNPVVAPESHEAIERREDYTPWIWAVAGLVLLFAGLFFAGTFS
jgi:hypothetical protein